MSAGVGAVGVPFSWRDIFVPVLLPGALFAVGQGAFIPLMPVIAHERGADLAGAALIAAALAGGELISALPAGVLLGRLSERLVMIMAVLTGAFGFLLSVADSVALLTVGSLLVGAAGSTFSLARQAALTISVPYGQRARALSAVGGMYRFGIFVGPFAATALLALGAALYAALLFSCAMAVCSLLVLIFHRPAESPASRRPAPVGAVDSLRRVNWTRIRRAGALSVTVSGLRAVRILAVPLWGTFLDFRPETIALVVGITGLVDFALFTVSGALMDRFGRRAAAVPSLCGLGLGFILLCLGSAAAPFFWFVTGSTVLAVANGIGSGILMTVGADLADQSNPSPFLAVWRVLSAAGAAGAPLIFSGLIAFGGLTAATGLGGLVGLASAAVFSRMLRRPPGTQSRATE